MDVFDRPLFQNRAARDRLKDMGNVQGFQVGGGVTADPSGAIIRQYRQRPIRPEGISSLVSEPPSFELVTLPGGEGPAGEFLYDRASGEVRLPDGSAITNPGIAETVSRNIQSYLSSGGGSRAPGLESGIEFFTNKAKQAAEDGYVGPSMDFAEQALGLRKQLDQLPEQADPVARYMDRDVLAVEGPEAMMMQMSPEQLDIFNNLDRAAEKPAPDVAAEKPALNPAAALTTPAAPAPPKGLSAMEADARDRGPRAPAALDRRSTMEADARDRGPLISDPTAVAAGLNSPEAEVRDKTIADFMQEFTSAAPKYEGTDKGLLLAQIGFAIAAGESPNAMQNIANGLLAGSDMLLKDKAAKSEFDRQLQLSAMQYGLQEVGKQRTRAEQTLNFVALEDTVYKGRKIKAGDSVYIPYGDIEKNGGVVPSGFGDSSMVTAITDRAKAVSEALEKARQEELLDDTFAESQREKFSRAASTAISAERGLGYMEAAIIKVGEKGNITGLAGTADDLVSKVAAAAGLSDVNEQFNSREEVQGLVKKAFQNLIPAALSGVQTANSISNRDIEILADAYVNSMLKDGVFSMATITEDKLLDSMKGAVALLESERQQSLVDMGTIEKTLVGRTLRSGAEGTSLIEPYRDLIPGQGGVSQPLRLGSLVYGEDGIYEIMRPGN